MIREKNGAPGGAEEFSWSISFLCYNEFIDEALIMSTSAARFQPPSFDYPTSDGRPMRRPIFTAN
jgi:hypothetical protein